MVFDERDERPRRPYLTFPRADIFFRRFRDLLFSSVKYSRNTMSNTINQYTIDVFFQWHVCGIPVIVIFRGFIDLVENRCRVTIAPPRPEFVMATRDVGFFPLLLDCYVFDAVRSNYSPTIGFSSLNLPTR